MEKIITIILNIVLFIYLIFNVENYADDVLFCTTIILIVMLIFYLFRYKKSYIPKKIILINIMSIIVELGLIVLFKKLDIWYVTSGFMGLGAGPLGMLLYFFAKIAFVIIIVIINILKYLVKLINSKIR